MTGRMTVLGTDGFGRSDTRTARRRFFEVDRYHITVAALNSLARAGDIPRKKVKDAIEKYEIHPGKPDPTIA